ncbi:MAG: phytoene desaturase, partial [Flavobacteriales bacterium]|nr:phytoene desaturase [Flavobacteriales bacterium]
TATPAAAADRTDHFIAIAVTFLESELTSWLKSALSCPVKSSTIFRSFSKYIRKYFKHPRILQLLEFPVLFLGAKPEKTPALYSLMNYADTALGTWYPMGGMHKIIEGFVQLAKEKGVEFKTGTEVQEIIVENNRAVGVKTAAGSYMADAIIAGADYHHVEQHLIPKSHRMYDENYWSTRTMSPSSLLFYIGVNRKVKGLKHHNLFFDAAFEQHASEIYDEPAWPEDPLFYVCAPSVTDASVAPEGKENLFFLIPLAPGMEHNEEKREEYLNIMLDRIAKQTGDNFKDDIEYCRSYAHKEFEEDYHAYKGNAYGLANTLLQTAFLKPKMRNKKVAGLYFAGQLTTPGPGVPPSIISGQVAATEVLKELNVKTHAVA